MLLMKLGGFFMYFFNLFIFYFGVEFKLNWRNKVIMVNNIFIYILYFKLNKFFKFL